MAYPFPTEHERRALFRWLEQASSLTAWRRVHSYHRRFVEIMHSVYEEEQRTAGMKRTIEPKEISDLLLGQEGLDAALVRLERGDRACFDAVSSPGHFRQGLSALLWWHDMYIGAMFGRNGFGPSDSPRWLEIQAAMGECVLALSDIGVVLQRSDTDAPAPIDQMGSYTSQKGASLIKWWLERKDLPAVPVADPEIAVATGEVLPHHGIWEPVRTPATLRERLAAGLAGNRPLDGCMNFLHGGAAAPTIEDDGDGDEGRPTTWRLLWRDDRYGANPIPARERDYVFIEPVPGKDPYAYPNSAAS